MKKPKAWSVTKEEKLVEKIIELNNACAELGLPELVPMEAAKVILEKSRERVEAMRAFPLRVVKAASKLVQ